MPTNNIQDTNISNNWKPIINSLQKKKPPWKKILEWKLWLQISANNKQNGKGRL